MQKLPFVVLAVLLVLGCGAGTGTGQQKDEGTQAAGTASAGLAQAEPQAQAAEMSGSEAAPAESEPAANDDMAKAEARRAAAYRTTPAVDTSQLRDAPPWKLQGLDGKPLTSQDLKGKVVLVDFWATWCQPCRRSIPHLIDLHEKYKDQGLEVVGMSLDNGPDVVRPFVKQQAITYPIVMGNQKIAQDFGGVRGIPTAFIVTQDGKIYRKIVGLVPKERYENDIKALLGLS